MLIRLSNAIVKPARGLVVAAALLLFLVFTAVVLPDQARQADAYVGEAGSPDTSFFYTPQDLARMAGAYGAQGRLAYVRARATFDVAWPLVYGAFLSLALSWLNRRAFRLDSGWQLSNLLPVLAVLADYLENLCTGLVMARFPQEVPLAAILAPWFTAVKWLLLVAAFGCLLFASTAALGRALAARRSSV